VNAAHCFRYSFRVISSRNKSPRLPLARKGTRSSPRAEIKACRDSFFGSFLILGPRERGSKQPGGHRYEAKANDEDDEGEDLPANRYRVNVPVSHRC